MVYDDGDEEEFEYKEFGLFLVEVGEVEVVKVVNVSKRVIFEIDSDFKRWDDCFF